MKTTALADRPRFMFTALWDLPNFITLTGFALSMLAIVLAVREQFELAMIAVLWAVAADWIDGWVAGRLRDRPAKLGEMGAQLDSFADLVSSGIFPAVLIASLGQYSPVAVGLAVAIGAAGLLRLSFFNVYGATSDGRVMGLPIAHNILVLAILMLARPWMDQQVFFWMFGAAALLLAALNVGWFYWRRESNAAIPYVLAYIALTSLLLLAVGG